MSLVYYNEYDKFAAAWLRKLIEAGYLPKGDVDERSIIDVRADDLRTYRQCHFFAGIGGWSHALRLAGWADDREIWTGSCPCQPFSVAGKGKGKSDERHLWPVFFDLIREARPAVVMGEQVAGKSGYDWFDGVTADLEGEGYAARAVDIPACAVDAPHIRQRLYWLATDLADANGSRSEAWLSVSALRRERLTEIFDNGGGGQSGARQERMADADCSGIKTRPSDRMGNVTAGISDGAYPHHCRQNSRYWSDYEWLTGADGKTRRSKPGICLLVDGLPGRVGRLRGYGNAIVPPLAAEVIKAFMEVAP
ncbi:MAG: DNA cytosine methyltransferase [Chitinophagaceae bacterium]